MTFEEEIKNLKKEFFANRKMSIPFYGMLFQFMAILSFILFYNLSLNNLLYIIPLGTVAIFLGGNLAHDSAHGATFNSLKLNNIFSFVFLDIMLSVHYKNWQRVHNKHHNYCNIPGKDENIDLYPWLRLNKKDKHLDIHRFQHYYIYLVYSLGLMVWFFRDIYYTKTIQNYFGKISHLFIFLFIPVYIIGGVKGFLFWFFYICWNSFLFFFFSFLNHIQEQ